MTSCVDLPAKKCSSRRRRVVIAVAMVCATVAAALTGLLGVDDKARFLHAYALKSDFRWAHGPPANHVYFLKTHKCASTTLQRIILMYGMKHNLSFALPAHGLHQFWPRPFSLLSTSRSASYPHFDIMAVHARYSPSARHLVYKDTVYLSIVRDPAEHLQSLYEYYQISRCVSNRTFEQFVLALHSDRFGVTTTMRHCPFNVVSNMQMYDFGFSEFAIRTKSLAQQSINHLNRTFHLVLVADLFDESLVLMGDLLNWSDPDLVYLRANARPSSAPIGENIRKMIYEWNWADKMLYDHFRSRLEHELSCKQAYVKWRVAKLVSLQNRWRSLCVKNVTSSRATRGGNATNQSVVRGPDLTIYELTDEGRRNDTCLLLTMSEVDIVNRIHRLWPEVVKPDAGKRLPGTHRRNFFPVVSGLAPAAQSKGQHGRIYSISKRPMPPQR